jgi:hypothetical protein
VQGDELFSQPGGGGMQSVVPGRRSLLSFEVRTLIIFGWVKWLRAHYI